MGEAIERNRLVADGKRKIREEKIAAKNLNKPPKEPKTPKAPKGEKVQIDPKLKESKVKNFHRIFL